MALDEGGDRRLFLGGYRMATPRRAEQGDQTGDGSLRHRVILLATVLAILALLHFVDHVVRGELVISRGLNPAWNHSGWPFNTRSDRPYILPIAFVLVFGALLGGILLTLRGRLWAGYWLAVSIALTALLVIVHFVGFESGTAETPRVIALSYPDNLRRVIALVVLSCLFAGLAALALQAVRTRQRSGRW